MMKQDVFLGTDWIKKIQTVLYDSGSKKPMLICGKHLLQNKDLLDFINHSFFTVTVFNDFKSNPDYKSAIKAAETILNEKNDFLLAIGGGSAIDVAKCARRFYGMDLNADCLKQEPRHVDLKLLAAPTTAGSGSEATHFAVLYRDNKKYSVSGFDMLPDYVLLNPQFLHGLPLYQKKACYLDALCQAVESWWSLKANEESIAYSKKAIKLLLQNFDSYFFSNNSAFEEVLLGAHYAGRAINITTTTAAHAMSYGLTKRYGLAHGHAVALCMKQVWKHLLLIEEANHKPVLENIAAAFGCVTGEEALDKFVSMIKKLGLEQQEKITAEDLEWLASSVNVQRLNNHPQPLSHEKLHEMYQQIFYKV